MEINQLVTKLWNSHLTSDDLLNRGGCYHELEPNRPVLFMGLNPSYVGDNPNNGLLPDGKHFWFNLPDASPGGYYSPFYELAQAMGIQRNEWTYQDVFYFRCTNQKTIPQNDAFSSFKTAHLVLTQQVLEFLQPKLIIVCNSEAATYFGVRDRPGEPRVYMGYRFDEQQNKEGKREGYILNPDTGCHLIRSCQPHLDNGTHDAAFRTNLVGTQIYFTSILKYKSIIDRERTAWHLRNIYRKICG